MKSNLKQDLENFRKDCASDINILDNRVHSLQEKFDNYLVPRLQKLDGELVELKNKIGNTNVEATLDSDAKRISELEERVKHLEGDPK